MAKRNNNNRNNNKNQQSNNKEVSNRTTSKELREGDVFKIGVPVKVTDIADTDNSLHDALNRGQKVIKLQVEALSGPWVGEKRFLQTTESDRIEMVSRSYRGRTIGERISMWWSTVTIPFFSRKNKD